MPDIIIFNCIAANNMNKNAGIFVGDNAATGWDSNNKVEDVINQVAGAANVFTAILTMLNDNDFIDTPIFDGDIEAGPGVQA
ncbi:MAG: hypothetical protein APF77_19905 [Clostridia bacterium BRH_c25]|nr:MAG: hypothetical protein APF77_19905 [Clostridia bacterium BRH_c25]